MKRKNIVEKLLNEGISQRTICDLNDKQLNLLYNRINEQTKSPINVSKDDKTSIENAKKSKTPFMTYEEEAIDSIDTEIAEDDKFHPMTTKGEISEMVKKKLKK
jgi:hypothetical protein